ncbi:MAG: glycosyltransferase family 4 protein, partial [Syntrophaceae bacterium]|nr:glycosyltransferase family 4 protein [Syntrophaceae bacterium]
MRFGSIDLFLEAGDWKSRVGRPLANVGFLKALLTHGRYDSYYFFCPDLHHLKRFRERLPELIPDPKLQGRVQTTLQVALAEIVREQEFEVFHQGDFTYYMPQIIGLRNRLARVPFPITGVTHSIDPIFMNSRYLELILAGPAPYDGIVCSSPGAHAAVEKGLGWVGKQLRERTGVAFPTHLRLELIPLGIEESLFQEENRKEARAFFRFPPDAMVVLSVGRISLRHKADWSPVLELFARMESQKELGKILLLIAGGGQSSDVSLLESMINQMGLNRRILLFPNFAPEIKPKLYQASDFYLSIIDNFQETFGLTVLEAMASGLPVVISDFSGYRDFISHGREGFLIPTTWAESIPDFLRENMGILEPSMARLYLSQMVAVDLEKLKSALLRLARDEKLRFRMGAAAKSKAMTYRWSNIIPAYERFWSELKEESRHFARNPIEPPNILAGDCSSTFSHYPSRRLSGKQEISLTDYGTQILKDSAKPVRYEDVQVCLFPDLERFLLNSLLEQPRSVANLREMSRKSLEATKGQVDFILLWLLKHG